MSKNITEKKSDEKYLMIQCICNIIGKNKATVIKIQINDQLGPRSKAGFSTTFNISACWNYLLIDRSRKTFGNYRSVFKLTQIVIPTFSMA